eukprot:654817-Amphidinium_carterae.1
MGELACHSSPLRLRNTRRIDPGSLTSSGRNIKIIDTRGSSRNNATTVKVTCFRAQTSGVMSKEGSLTFTPNHMEECEYL